MRSKANGDLSDLQRQLDHVKKSSTNDIERIKRKADAEVAELRQLNSSLKSRLASVIKTNSLPKPYANQLQTEKEHTERTAKLENEHSDKTAKLEKEYSEKIAKLAQEYSEKTAKLQNEFTKQLEALNVRIVDSSRDVEDTKSATKSAEAKIVEVRDDMNTTCIQANGCPA